jgi:GH35 family endo-1,4-beta-xylanase
MMEGAGLEYDPATFSKELDAARDRIRKIRCSGAEVRLTDRQGKPVSNLRVEIEQTRSDFCWGDQLWELDTLFRHGFAGCDRVRHFTRRFTECLNSANCLTYWTEAPRNDGPKHMEFQGEDRLDGFEAQVNWALHNGLTPKGHPIFWSIPKGYPEWLARYPIETQWKFIEVRVRNLVARFKGRVKIWDVVNEPMWEAAPKNLPRRHWPHVESVEDICEYIVPVLRWAREEDPAALYVINDYGMEVDTPGRELRDKNGKAVTAKSQRDRFTALFRRLAGEGACPDGLGMQAHTGGWITPVQQQAILDDFSTAGVPLHYTEFWGGTGPLLKAGIDPDTADKLEAEYVANIMTMAFAHPSVAAFYFWGEITGSFRFKNDHNSGGLPTSSHEPKPVYWRVKDLLRREWMTRETLTTDADGKVAFRGFHGDYRLHYRTTSDMPVAATFQILPTQDNVHHLTIHRPV